jgi:hypothetical protein
MERRPDLLLAVILGVLAIGVVGAAGTTPPSDFDESWPVSLAGLVQIHTFSGGGGIRTLGTLARTTVFETAPFNHSGTPPGTRHGDGEG